MRSANKKKELTDDLLKEFEEKVQKITDKFTAEVDKVCDAKNKELMEIWQMALLGNKKEKT